MKAKDMCRAIVFLLLLGCYPSSLWAETLDPGRLGL